jgi:PAS domain S-box-containing protein
MVLLWRRRALLAPRVLRLLLAAMAATIAAEMSFTLYTDVYGVANVIGHLFKLVSFLLVYRAVVATNMSAPFEMLFRDLSQSRDALVRERDLARRYIDIAGVILLVLDREGRVQLVNLQGTRVLGYDAGAIVGKNWFQHFVPAPQRDRLQEVFLRLMEGQGQLAASVESPVCDRAGAEHTIAWRNTVLRDDRGVIVGTLSSGEDVTERKVTEASLRASEKRFRSLFEHAPDAYYICDLDGRFVDANRAAEQLVGRTRDDLAGKSFAACGLLPPSQLDRALVLLQRSARGESTGPDELVLLHRDGHSVSVDIRTEPIEIDGAPLILGIAHDITNRKADEQSLRLQRDLFMSLFSNSPDAIALLDAENRITDVNPAFSSTFGYTTEDVRGADIDSVIVPDDHLKEARELTRESLRGSFGRYADTVRRARDGTLVHVSVFGVPIVSNGNRVGTFAIYQNITGRKQSEADLRASEEKFRALFEQSIDAIYTHDYNGTHVEANQAWLGLFGYSREELASIDSARDVYVDPRDRDEFLKRIQESGLVADEVRFKKKDGTAMVCQRTVVARRDSTGHIVGFQGIIRDITERVRVEDEVRRNEARLRSLVSILQHEATTVQEFLDYALDEAVALTDSKIGYIYFYDEISKQFTLNTWSREVMHECTIQQPQTVYQLEKTGIWGEVVRQRQPIVVNDFDAPHPLKRGYPQGHAKLYRYASIPVLSAGRIVAVVGVANKDEDYTDTDVLQLTLLMDSVWGVVERKLTEEKVRSFAERLERAMSVGSLAWWQMRLPSGAVEFDDRKATMLGYSPSDFAHYSDFTALLHPDDVEHAMRAMQDHLDGSAERYEVEYRMRGHAGDYRWFRDVGSVTERDGEGRPTLVTGVVLDISDLKDAEERLSRSNEELRDLAARLDVAREEERASVAWELHDEVAQALSAVKMDLASCSTLLPVTIQEQVRPALDRMTGLLDATIARLRRLYTDLVPVMLEDLGLPAAIEWHAQQFALQSDVAVHMGHIDPLRLSDERLALALYRVLQETLEHAYRDHRATEMTIDLTLDDGAVSLRLVDNGQAASPDDTGFRCGLVLASIRERVHPWGGSVSVESSIDRGTELRVAVPFVQE